MDLHSSPTTMAIEKGEHVINLDDYSVNLKQGHFRKSKLRDNELSQLVISKHLHARYIKQKEFLIDYS